MEELAILTENLKGSQHAIEKAEAKLQSFISHFDQLDTHVKSLRYIHSKLPEPEDETETTFDQLNLAATHYQHWSTLSIQKIHEIEKVLIGLRKDLIISDSDQRLKIELTDLQKKLLDAEQRNIHLESDISTISKLAADVGSFMDSAQNYLSDISVAILQLRHHICTVSDEIPSEVNLDHESIVPENKEDVSGIDWCRTIFRTDIKMKNLRSLTKAKEIKIGIEKAMKQIKHLKEEVECAIELSKIIGIKTKIRVEALGSDSEKKLDAKKLQEQVIRQKMLLIAREEQICFLKSKLEINKNITVDVLNGLKSRYENEKIADKRGIFIFKHDLESLYKRFDKFVELHQTLVSSYEDKIEHQNEVLRLAEQKNLELTMKLELPKKLEELAVDTESLNKKEDP